MRTLVIAAFAGAVVLAAPASAQLPIITEGPVQLSLSGRLQTQFNTSTADSVFSTFELRRARVGVDLVVDEWIEGRIEWNFAHPSSGVGVSGRLEDAYIDLGFDDAFALQVGQFKKPFSRHELTSSARIVPIEAGLRIRGLGTNAEHYQLLRDNGYLAREIGAQIHGQIGMLGYGAGVFNGAGQNNLDVNDAKSYAARLNLKPFDAPFEIGAAASYRDRTMTDSLDRTVTEEGLAIEVDALWGGFRRPGITLQAEAMQAENFATDDPMMGALAIISWFQPVGDARVEGIEPLFRASYGDPSTAIDDDGGILLTPGINVYFHGRNRLMLNWDYFMPQLEDADAESALRGQLQLFF